MEFRDLASVDQLLNSPPVAALPRKVALAASRAVLADARLEIAAGRSPQDLSAQVAARAAEMTRPRLVGVINATGVILHTNLGRAPLAAEALERLGAVSRGYSNLELDMAGGRRGSRHKHLSVLLRLLTGAQDAIVVNNNAAALLLSLAALGAGREVIVSRGELIEIGDGFRIPEILACSGARLREVGTTNRTTVADYERALSESSGVLLRVHQSNFRTIGFVGRPDLAGLVALAREHSLPLVDDLGSGTLLPVQDEPLVRESIAAGCDLVTFSGDKLLGGPQAGIIAGRADLIARLRRHQLLRALRPDKLTLAALEATLQLYLDPERAMRAVPVLRMLNEPVEVVHARALRLAELTDGSVEASVGRVGGGALPLLELESAACALEGPLHGPLRQTDPPVIGILRDGRTLLDCRTVADEEIEVVARAVASARRP